MSASSEGTVSRANDYQVGGNHYKTAYEHWDVVLDLGHVGPLEYAATKYVTRWRKKDGIAGLKKALHYCNKLIESVLDGRTPVPQWKHSPRQIGALIARFNEVNSLGDYERAFNAVLFTWKSVDTLYEARDLLLKLIDDADQVPAEDSSRHAAGAVDPNAVSHSRTGF